MIPRSVQTALLVTALLLPVLVTISAALAWLLAAVGDETGAALTRGVALLGGIAWVVALVALVVCQAVNQLSRPEDE